METTNNLSQSLLQNDKSLTTMTLTNENSFFYNFKNINTTTWILIIIILAFLGFNIFTYLAKGTQTFVDIFAPLTEKLLGTTVGVTSQAVDVSAEGAKAVVGNTSNVIQSGLTAVQNITPNNASHSIKGQNIDEKNVDIMQQSSLNKALNTAQSQKNIDQDYQANEASSSVHSAGKSGWCYVGNDRGFRSCVEVGVNDLCMSGDIFPSQEICMNPNLRP